MPKLFLPQLKKRIAIDINENFFEVLRKNDIPIASSCQGKQVCGRCWIEVAKGNEYLNLPDSEEVKLLEKFDCVLEKKVLTRVACCTCFVREGEAMIKTTYW